ncbi:MAG TPA: hypothetical protein VJR89_17255 [Polyangiales bacterium]|nr:hypothetical protein [Polyangiales bacterium]
MALTLSCGCLRFGYEPVDALRDSKADAGQRDSGTGGIGAGAGYGDAATAQDAGETPLRDAGAPDAGKAGMKDAGAQPLDGGTDAAVDAGPSDAGGSIDAALADAALEDAAMVEDAAVDAGPVDPCAGRSDVSFCDGFEDPELSNWNYPIAMNGELERSTDPVRSGSAALHASTGPSNGANAAARYGAKIFGHQTTGDVWARAWYYLPSSVTINTFFSTLLITEVEMPYFGCSVLVKPSRVELGGVTARFFTQAPFPRDRWTCVELHIRIHASTGICEAYVDGMIATQSAMTDTLPAMGYTSLEVGIHYTEPNQGPVEVYVDDVAAGTARVGCD